MGWSRESQGCVDLGESTRPQDASLAVHNFRVLFELGHCHADTPRIYNAGYVNVENIFPHLLSIKSYLESTCDSPCFAFEYLYFENLHDEGVGRLISNYYSFVITFNKKSKKPNN